MEELQASLNLCEEKYIRLFRAHDKLQKLNQCLEEKLLNLAENHHEESAHFSSQVDELTQSLVEARIYIHQLEDENDRYRNDINAVVQLLQCKPSSFVSPKIGMLPEDLQRKVLGQKNGRKEKKIIKVQVPCTLPQMDIMYAVDNGRVGKRNEENDIVSAAIMATILKEREKERDAENKSSRCRCRFGGLRNIRLPTHSVETQTLPSCTISYSGFTCPEYSVIPIKQTQQNQGQKSPMPMPEDKEKLKDSGLGDLGHRSPAPTRATPLSNYQILSNLTSASASSPVTTTRPALRPNSLKLTNTQCKKLTLSSNSPQNHNNNNSNSNNNNGDHSHWSTTVLVQHPPRQQRIDPMSMYNSSSKSNSNSKSHSVTSTPTPTTPMSSSLDMDESDESQPLMRQSSSSISAASTKYPSSQSRQQYYRAQKRSFWTRSSSTTSTETEI